MAMNKAERERMSALEKQLIIERHNNRIAKALRYTDPVTPDLPPPEGGSMGMTHGFDIYGYGIENKIEPVSSSSTSHYRYHEGSRMGGSQKSRHLFSTRLLALRAARNQVEEAAARRLAEIDAEIEREIAEPTPHPAA